MTEVEITGMLSLVRKKKKRLMKSIRKAVVLYLAV